MVNIKREKQDVNTSFRGAVLFFSEQKGKKDHQFEISLFT
jgi:hypothetical protein